MCGLQSVAVKRQNLKNQDLYVLSDFVGKNRNKNDLIYHCANSPNTDTSIVQKYYLHPSTPKLKLKSGAILNFGQL